MTTRKQKKSVLTSEDKLELLHAVTKAIEVCDDKLECGSSCADDVHDARNKMRSIAEKLGYKQENWYSRFTV